MQQPPIFFVAGLPRSGSTLLMNLLGQNPAHHVTPTNGLLDMMIAVRDMWANLPEFRAQGLDVVQPRIINMMHSMVEGFYKEEFKAGKVVFDKSRGWLAYIEMMRQILDRPLTVLVTVRDIRAIVASVEKLYQTNPMTSLRPDDYLASQTIEGRAGRLLAETGVVGLAIARLRDALRRPHKNRILLIPYNRLCLSTQAIMSQLHRELNLPEFIYDPKHVEQITKEDDSLRGVAMHNVKPQVELVDPTPWKGILPDALCDALVTQFGDIQRYAEASE